MGESVTAPIPLENPTGQRYRGNEGNQSRPGVPAGSEPAGALRRDTALKITTTDKSVLLQRRHGLLRNLIDLELALVSTIDESVLQDAKRQLIRECGEIQAQIDAWGLPADDTDVAAFADREFHVEDKLRAECGLQFAEDSRVYLRRRPASHVVFIPDENQADPGPPAPEPALSAWLRVKAFLRRLIGRAGRKTAGESRGCQDPLYRL